VRLRGHTVAGRELARAVRADQVVADAEPTREDFDLPRTRRDCLPGGCNEARPCPMVGCKHHLFLEVNPDTGSIKFNYPELEPWEMGESCALDLSGPGRWRELELLDTDAQVRGDERTLEEVGDTLNLTRERVRQIELRAVLKVRMVTATIDQLGRRPVRNSITNAALAAVASDESEDDAARKRARIERALLADPTEDNRQIAAATGAGRVEVARVRDELGLAPTRRRRRGPAAEEG
jgi:hypothetical protein